MSNETQICDIEQEKFLLSAMFLKNGECVPKMLDELSADDFSRPQHRIVFSAISKIYSTGTTPDILTLIQYLKKTGALDKVGLDFVYSLVEYANTTAYVDTYAKSIKEFANRRRLIELGDKLKRDAEKGAANVEDIIAAVTANFSSISPVSNLPRIASLHDFFSNDFDAFMKKKSVYSKRRSGFGNLDKHQDWAPGVFGIGATPAAGKTTFCQQLLQQFALDGETCFYCSYEMSLEEIALKSVARQLFHSDSSTHITASNMHRYFENSPEDNKKINEARQAVLDLLLRNFKVIELHNENTDRLLNLIRRLSYDLDKPPIVCVDYLQLLAAMEGEDNLKIAVDKAICKLKNFQRDTGTTFIAVSSFNRGNYVTQAAFESFKESGGIDYGLDVAWALQLNAVNNLSLDKGGVSAAREQIDKAKKETPRKIHLKVVKNRRGANYDCYFEYFPANDYFRPCDGFGNETTDEDSADEPAARDKITYASSLEVDAAAYSHFLENNPDFSEENMPF